jgi:AcrR family transcriptional regulator
LPTDPTPVEASDRRTRRSDATKSEILRAARSRFANDGYQKATIRAIAADANIDPSMVMRYYGNKQRLFAEASDIDLRLPTLTDLPKRRLGEILVSHFLSRWEGDPSDDALLMLLRSAVTDELVAKRLHEIFKNQLVPAVRAVLPEDRRTEAPVRAGLIATQMLGLALCRHILRIPPVVAFSSSGTVASMGPTIQRYLMTRLPDQMIARRPQQR